MNRNFPLRWSVSLLATAVALGGCSWLHHRDNYYAKAAETRPLDVPPDLDTPVTSSELVVPAAGTPSAAPAAGTTAASAPVGSAPPAAASSERSGGGLHVADSVGHTWQRVGLALERAQVGSISARDEAAHSYSVEVSGLRAAPALAPAAEHHWYSRVLHPFGGGSSSPKSQPVSGHLNVKVSADGDGARVDVEGNSTDGSAAEAARRVLETLRERLS